MVVRRGRLGRGSPNARTASSGRARNDIHRLAQNYGALIAAAVLVRGAGGWEGRHYLVLNKYTQREHRHVGLAFEFQDDITGGCVVEIQRWKNAQGCRPATSKSTYPTLLPGLGKPGKESPGSDRRCLPVGR